MVLYVKKLLLNFLDRCDSRIVPKKERYSSFYSVLHIPDNIPSPEGSFI